MKLYISALFFSTTLCASAQSIPSAQRLHGDIYTSFLTVRPPGQFSQNVCATPSIGYGGGAQFGSSDAYYNSSLNSLNVLTDYATDSQLIFGGTNFSTLYVFRATDNSYSSYSTTGVTLSYSFPTLSFAASVFFTGTDGGTCQQNLTGYFRVINN